MTRAGQTPTLIELVDAMKRLGFIKPTKEETYRFMDAKGAREEFDFVSNEIGRSLHLGLELAYATTPAGVLTRFSRLYTKVTGRPFNQEEAIPRREPAQTSNQKPVPNS